jgi:hypothetical protein
MRTGSRKSDDAWRARARVGGGVGYPARARPKTRRRPFAATHANKQTPAAMEIPPPSTTTSSLAWELRVAQAEALLQAAERERAAAEREERALGAQVAAAARKAEAQRLALARAEARRYGLAADLMTCARTTEELRERAAAARGEATA